MSDPNFGVGAINGVLGWQSPDPAFANVSGDRATAIPWFEDDLALNSLELWVNRTLEHAAAAAGYGVTGGLLGLLWRTWETSPQITALARAGWVGGENLTDVEVWDDFCVGNFGADTAQVCVELFLAVDGFATGHKGVYHFFFTFTSLLTYLLTYFCTYVYLGMGPSPDGSRLPRAGQACCGGPMKAANVSRGTQQVPRLAEFEAWQTTVKGKANAERAGRWVSVLQYVQQTVVVANASFALAQTLGGGGGAAPSVAVAKGASPASPASPTMCSMVSAYPSDHDVALVVYSLLSRSPSPSPALE